MYCILQHGPHLERILHLSTCTVYYYIYCILPSTCAAPYHTHYILLHVLHLRTQSTYHCSQVLNVQCSVVEIQLESSVKMLNSSPLRTSQYSIKIQAAFKHFTLVNYDSRVVITCKLTTIRHSTIIRQTIYNTSQRDSLVSTCFKHTTSLSKISDRILQTQIHRLSSLLLTINFPAYSFRINYYTSVLSWSSLVKCSHWLHLSQLCQIHST